MTTVAIDGNGYIAADGLAVLNGQIPHCFDAKKIFKFTHEDESFFVGMAGDYSVIMEAVEYLDDLLSGTLKENLVTFDPDAIQFVKINQDAEIYLGQVASGGHKIIWMDIGKNAIAIGSGGDAAMTAMKIGQSAEDAVHTAMLMDVFSGGEVVVHHISELDFLGDVADAMEAQAEELMEQAKMIRESKSEELNDIPMLDGSDPMDYTEIEDDEWERLSERLEAQRKHLDDMKKPKDY